jgi:hypothetical protein
VMGSGLLAFFGVAFLGVWLDAPILILAAFIAMPVTWYVAARLLLHRPTQPRSPRRGPGTAQRDGFERGGELFCSRCGTRLSGSANFCPSCGAARDAERTPEPGAQQQARLSPVASLRSGSGTGFTRIAALPLWVKVLLAMTALIGLGLSVVLSPFMAIMASLVLLVAVFAILIRKIRRRPLRRWGSIALASLLLLVVFSGISYALYGTGQPKQVSSPSAPTEEAKLTAQETPVAGTATSQLEKTEDATAASQPETTTEDATGTPETKTAATPSESTKEDTQNQTAYDTTVRVARVIDGDTIEISPSVDGKKEVRLIGMDTPETKNPTAKYSLTDRRPPSSQRNIYRANKLG